MTNIEIARRLRLIARHKPTDIWRELHALAMDLEYGPRPTPEQQLLGTDLEKLTPASDAAATSSKQPDDMEALVRATQPPTRPARVTPLAVARAILRGRR
jgi:hypothetical protein